VVVFSGLLSFGSFLLEEQKKEHNNKKNKYKGSKPFKDIHIYKKNHTFSYKSGVWHFGGLKTAQNRKQNNNAREIFLLR